MSSVRVPGDLLAALHRARPSGVSLAALLRRLLDEAGGPDDVHARLGAEDRQARARARVERLRAAGHRSVVVEPGHQEGLAWASLGWVRALESAGSRRHDPAGRTITLSRGRRVQRASNAARLELRRTSLD